MDFKRQKKDRKCILKAEKRWEIEFKDRKGMKSK